MKPFVTLHLPAVLWTLLVGLLLLVPGDFVSRATGWLATGEAPSGSDRLGHLLLFLVLAVLVQRSLGARWSPWRAAVWTLLGTVAYGAALEVGQSWIPGRDPEVVDALMNGLGSAVGLVAQATIAAPRRR
jgi:VanZ like protein